MAPMSGLSKTVARMDFLLIGAGGHAKAVMEAALATVGEIEIGRAHV